MPRVLDYTKSNVRTIEKYIITLSFPDGLKAHPVNYGSALCCQDEIIGMTQDFGLANLVMQGVEAKMRLKMASR